MKARSILWGSAAFIIAALLVDTGVAGASSSSRPVLLGRKNSATTSTVLTNTKGSPLALNAGRGHAPLTVNSATKVANLNADRLDGLDSTQIQRRLARACPAGQAIESVSAVGAVSCAATGASFSSVLADMNGGVGIATCPDGTHPVGGGALPSVTNATDVPYLVASMVHVTNGSFDGWEGIASDANGSYDGGGYVYVTCTAGSVTATTGAMAAQQQTNRVAALARHSN